MNRTTMVKHVIQLGTTLLMLAACATGFAAEESLVSLAEQKQFDRAISLVDAGADVGRTTADGTTALHWAA